MKRGPVKRQLACARVSNLPTQIAHRELKVVAKKLGWPRECLQVVNVENTHGPGNLLTIEMESDALTEVVTGFGQRGVSAEKVAARPARPWIISPETYPSAGIWPTSCWFPWPLPVMDAFLPCRPVGIP